ncbi:MAG: ThuA domain-containing protein [Planctomycetota bacterium]|nr:ThuA domain-containing protein [Planctomycetota bacterium]
MLNKASSRLALAFLMALYLLPLAVTPAADKKTRVLVWDSRQPAQKSAYKNFLGNHIAEHLKGFKDLEVRSAALDDPEQGLSDALLEQTDVMVMWVHGRKGEVSAAKGKAIVERIKAGKLQFIALHSAHWATPFVEAMNYRTLQEAKKAFPAAEGETVEFKIVPPPRRYTTPKKSSLQTPRFYPRKYPGGKTVVTVHLPNCCFPGYRPDGKPSHFNVLKTGHPVAKGLPRNFTIPNTEMYNEPFNVPDPDEVIIEERWPTGEWFRTAAVWNIDKGKVFYFRPGHETYKVFHEKTMLKVVENAVRWLGSLKQ